MKQLVLLATAVLISIPAAARAQTEGRVGVGASVTFNHTTDDTLDSAVSFGPLVRLNPRRGWGPAGALNWYRADLQNPDGGDRDFATLRIRPLMAGVSYTIGSGDDVLTSFSIVAGPSFNRAEFDDDFTPGVSIIDAENSFAVRPGVGVTWTIAPRAAIVGFAGYMINRPDVFYQDAAGRQFQDRWKADSIVLSIGAVYSIF